MAEHHSGGLLGALRRKAAVVAITGGLLSGAFVLGVPSTAGAAGSNPLGPTVAQVEALVATVENLAPTLELLALTYPCLVIDIAGALVSGYDGGTGFGCPNPNNP